MDRSRTLPQGARALRVWPDRLVTAQIETMALRVLYLVAIRGIRLANIARPRQAFKNAEIMVLRQEVRRCRAKSLFC